MTYFSRLRRTPGRRGTALLEELHRLGFDTIEAVAMACQKAGHTIHRNTIRRLVFEEGSTMQLPTLDALRAIGVSETTLRM